jgi:predicted transposase/invertase (TIGR01784 family)
VRDRYIRSLNYYNTTILDIEDKAAERGMEQGIEKVAKNMLKSRKPIEEIIEMTDLSEEQIKNLKP